MRVLRFEWYVRSRKLKRGPGRGAYYVVFFEETPPASSASTHCAFQAKSVTGNEDQSFVSAAACGGLYKNGLVVY